MCRSAADRGARGGSPWPAHCRGRNEANQERRQVPLRTWLQWWPGHSPAGDPRSDHTRLRRAAAKRTSYRYSASWRDLPGGCRRRLGGCWFTRRLRRQTISTTSETRPSGKGGKLSCGGAAPPSQRQPDSGHSYGLPWSTGLKPPDGRKAACRQFRVMTAATLAQSMLKRGEATPCPTLRAGGKPPGNGGGLQPIRI